MNHVQCLVIPTMMTAKARGSKGIICISKPILYNSKCPSVCWKRRFLYCYSMLTAKKFGNTASSQKVGLGRIPDIQLIVYAQYLVSGQILLWNTKKFTKFVITIQLGLVFPYGYLSVCPSIFNTHELLLTYYYSTSEFKKLCSYPTAVPLPYRAEQIFSMGIFLLLWGKISIWFSLDLFTMIRWTWRWSCWWSCWWS